MLTIILLLAATALLLFISYELLNHDFENTCIVLGVTSLFPAGSFVAALVIIIMALIGAPAEYAKQYERYNSLTYQYAHMDELYGDSRSMDRKSLMDDIREWNEDVVSGQKKHESLWTNWFEPVDWGQFKTIEMK